MGTPLIPPPVIPATPALEINGIPLAERIYDPRGQDLRRGTLLKWDDFIALTGIPGYTPFSFDGRTYIFPIGGASGAPCNRCWKAFVRTSGNTNFIVAFEADRGV